MCVVLARREDNLSLSHLPHGSHHLCQQELLKVMGHNGNVERDKGTIAQPGWTSAEPWSEDYGSK